MGRSGKLHLGEKVAVSNTLFNVSSGSIYIDDYTIFGQNVMILTGRHNFVSGYRAGLHEVMNLVGAAVKRKSPQKALIFASVRAVSLPLVPL